MELDRTELEQLLARIADAGAVFDEESLGRQGDAKLHAQLRHLKGLGLITFDSRGYVHDPRNLLIYNVEITAKGTVHLGRDGGMGQAVDTITIRIETEQFRAMLLARLDEGDEVSHPQRSALAEQIRTLPAKALEKLFGMAL